MKTPVLTHPATPLQAIDHVMGPDSAPFTVVMYCDFECPYCGEAFEWLRNLRRRPENSVRFVYRHFPLVDKHPRAQQAAEAAEAAASQGRFWIMHDLLFEHQDRLELTDLYAYANRSGLNLPQFKNDLHARIHASRVMRDVKAGRHSGVKGTPTFFLNGARLSDDDQLEELLNVDRRG
jgi:protein-disulfide isomerase